MRAPFSLSSSRVGSRRSTGTGMRARPERYRPVMELLSCLTSSTVPLASSRPPSSPAPGPRSIRRSAAMITSGSCSTTSTVLPRSRSSCMILTSLAVSRECRPIDGSSSTYSAPTSRDPSELASWMRCDSPPLSVDDRRSSVRYSRPTCSRKPMRWRTSASILPAISVCAGDSCSASKNMRAAVIVRAAVSQMLRPFRNTARASARSRCPRQSGHGA